MYIIQEIKETDSTSILYPLDSFFTYDKKQNSALEVLKHLPISICELGKFVSYLNKYMTSKGLYVFNLFNIIPDNKSSSKELPKNPSSLSILEFNSLSKSFPTEISLPNLNVYGYEYNNCLHANLLNLNSLSLPYSLYISKWNANSTRKELRWDKCCSSPEVNAELWNDSIKGNEKTYKEILKILKSKLKINVVSFPYSNKNSILLHEFQGLLDKFRLETDMGFVIQYE